MLVGLTVGAFFKFRFWEAGKLSEPEPESSAKGFRVRLAGVVGLLWYVVIIYLPACLWCCVVNT